MYAVQAHGHRVTTVEGLAKPDGSMSVLQDSFCEAHGLQCGYCTPGMLIAAQGLLNTNPDPTEAQRSEERRVGKECRDRWAPEQLKEQRRSNTTRLECMR